VSISLYPDSINRPADFSRYTDGVTLEHVGRIAAMGLGEHKFISGQHQPSSWFFAIHR
jgi:hypothetical protein